MDRLQIRLGASTQFFYLLLALLAVAITISLLLPIEPLFIRLLLIVAVAIHAMVVLRVHVLRLSPRAVVTVVCNDQGEWQLQRKDGSWDTLALNAWYVSLNIVTLEFAHGFWHRYPVVVFRDAVTGEGHRRLRVHLRQIPKQGHRTNRAT
jgi:hypothetical protein